MASPDHLLIFGASARAAAHSALRAGLRPWCADLFGDADLRSRCPAIGLKAGTYPEGFLDLLSDAPPGPWMYSGGLENRPELVHKLARKRSLWGNDAEVLAIIRAPETVARILKVADIPCPAVQMRPPRSTRRRWLVKPLASAGGARIKPWDKDGGTKDSGVYFQESIEGPSYAAIYVGDGTGAILLGVTRQLIGERWLHAGAFQYCGSIGPIRLDVSLKEDLQRLGNVLVHASGLRGLFGVDYIFRAEKPWPVEINPRYSASMEILEYAWQVPVLGFHRQAFDSPDKVALSGKASGNPASITKDFFGKAILFARRPVTLPADGPWLDVLDRPGPLEEMPTFADIPRAGQAITARHPILTFFARNMTYKGCLEKLRSVAEDLDHRLFVT